MLRNHYKQITWFLANIIIALIVGYFSSSAGHASTKDSFIIGMLVFTLTSIAQLIWEISSLSSSLEKSFRDSASNLSLNSTFKKISSNPELKDAIENIAELSDKGLALHQHNNSNSDVYSIFKKEIFNHLRDCQSNIMDASQGVIRVPKEISNVFWLKIINNIRHSYRTTNLITEYSDSFGQKPGKGFLDAQQKIAGKVGSENFKRIFIYKSEDLLNNKIELIKKQAELGITVKKLSLDSYNQLGQEQWSSRIGCSDFAIIDDEFVYITVVDDTTEKSTYVELTNNPVRLAAAKELFHLIDKNCDDIP